MLFKHDFRCTLTRTSTLRRFYTDAYDLFIIGIAKPMIATVYYPQLNGKLAKHDDLWITGVALVGTLVGQVGFSSLHIGNSYASAASQQGQLHFIVSALCII